MERLKRDEYRSRLIRRKYISKGNGKMRPLGMPVVEDRLLQGAASLLLGAIYEQDFLACSYGYRPKVGAQQAVKDLTFELQFGRYGYVVETDIKGFFDNIDHDWLLRMLEERAERFYRCLPKRLSKFRLAVAPEKTCIHRFSRFHPSLKTRFIFLGFEFYWEPDTKGIPRVWRRTARKKLRAGVKACKDWLKSNRHIPLNELMPTMVRKVRGHYNYFRAIGNSSLWTFYREAVGLLYKWLNRRSQRRSLTWDSLKRVLVYYAFPTPS